MSDEELQWSCRFCGHKLRADRKHAGKQTKCPRCGKLLWIPLQDLEPDELIEKLTKDPQAVPRASAAGELGRRGLNARRAVAHLVKASRKDPSALVRFRSLEAVARIVDGEKWPGPIPARIIEELIRVVKSDHGDATNDIEEFSSDPTSTICQKAQQALLRIGGAAAQPLAEAIREGSGNREAHDLLADALQRIRERHHS